MIDENYVSMHDNSERERYACAMIKKYYIKIKIKHISIAYGDITKLKSNPNWRTHPIWVMLDQLPS